MMLFPVPLREIYAKVQRNTQKGCRTYYAPLLKDESAIIRADYQRRLQLPVEGDTNTKFYTLAGMLIAVGYNRIVIGDYGAYIEFMPHHILQEQVKRKFQGQPSRPIKYHWLETRDISRTKVYLQVATVTYADYRPGMYYISPADLITEHLQQLYL